MRKVKPQNIEVGRIYLQVIGQTKLYKKRIDKGNKDEIWGTYIKSNNNYIFPKGEDGYVNYNSSTEFYLLNDKEIGELFLEEL
jgi:hypothetical protein